jgi:pimeloyl-ACP methyl ester carboxylesterase
MGGGEVARYISRYGQDRLRSVVFASGARADRGRHQAGGVGDDGGLWLYGLSRRLAKVSIPTLLLHGDADATVPYEGSRERTHATLPQSQLHVITGGPHGVNVSHRQEFDRVLLEFPGPLNRSRMRRHRYRARSRPRSSACLRAGRALR